MKIEQNQMSISEEIFEMVNTIEAVIHKGYNSKHKKLYGKRSKILYFKYLYLNKNEKLFIFN